LKRIRIQKENILLSLRIVEIIVHIRNNEKTVFESIENLNSFVKKKFF